MVGWVCLVAHAVETAMTKSEAQAEVFWMAFTALPRGEQRGVLDRLLRDQTLREDLIDLALIEERRDQPSRSLRAYLAETS